MVSVILLIPRDVTVATFTRLIEDAENIPLVIRRAMLGSWKFCVDDLGVCDPRILASSMPEHPAAQQVELGPPVHLPLDDLEPVDLALDLPVAPPLGQRGAHCLLIA